MENSPAPSAIFSYIDVPARSSNKTFYDDLKSYINGEVKLVSNLIDTLVKNKPDRFNLNPDVVAVLCEMLLLHDKILSKEVKTDKNKNVALQTLNFVNLYIGNKSDLFLSPITVVENEIFDLLLSARNNLESEDL